MTQVKAKPRKGSSGGAVALRVEEWDLWLYVAGKSERSVAAFANLKRLCEEHLSGRYRIKVVDLLRDPRLASEDQIVAIPTVVRKFPKPVRRTIGDLSDIKRTITLLDVGRG